MVEELHLKIISLKSVDSTQLYLKAQLKDKKLHSPICVIADFQTDGIGSRNNSWRAEEGNLYVSFALPLCELVSDLKIESASLYFSYILKETLVAFGSQVKLKWPNDLYVENLKVGGMITTVVGEDIVCGFGINIQKAPEGFGQLDITIDKIILLENYFKNLEKKELWKQVFSKYRLEFYQNTTFFTHVKNQKIKLSDALLESDGSLNINGERIYSLR